MSLAYIQPTSSWDVHLPFCAAHWCLACSLFTLQRPGAQPYIGTFFPWLCLAPRSGWLHPHPTTPWHPAAVPRGKKALKVPLRAGQGKGIQPTSRWHKAILISRATRCTSQAWWNPHPAQPSCWRTPWLSSCPVHCLQIIVLTRRTQLTFSIPNTQLLPREWETIISSCLVYSDGISDGEQPDGHPRTAAYDFHQLADGQSRTSLAVRHSNLISNCQIYANVKHHHHFRRSPKQAECI